MGIEYPDLKLVSSEKEQVDSVSKDLVSASIFITPNSGNKAVIEKIILFILQC